MFTGIVEEVGTISSTTSDKITIKCFKVLKDTKLGDSIAVNGVCLTVVDILSDGFCANVSGETFKVTNLKSLRQGQTVNLERALSLSSRLGGHIVSGHIDTVGEVFKLNKLDEFYELVVRFNSEFNKYVVKKGSITLDGISLTVADTRCDGDSIYVTCAIIPHTFNNTGLKYINTDYKVNLEFDILAKYVEKNLLLSDNKTITVDFLAQNGFV